MCSNVFSVRNIWFLQYFPGLSQAALVLSCLNSSSKSCQSSGQDISYQPQWKIVSIFLWLYTKQTQTNGIQPPKSRQCAWCLYAQTEETTARPGNCVIQMWLTSKWAKAEPSKPPQNWCTVPHLFFLPTLLLPMIGLRKKEGRGERERERERDPLLPSATPVPLLLDLREKREEVTANTGSRQLYL